MDLSQYGQYSSTGVSSELTINLGRARDEEDNNDVALQALQREWCKPTVLASFNPNVESNSTPSNKKIAGAKQGTRMHHQYHLDEQDQQPSVSSFILMSSNPSREVSPVRRRPQDLCNAPSVATPSNRKKVATTTTPNRPRRTTPTTTTTTGESDIGERLYRYQHEYAAKNAERRLQREELELQKIKGSPTINRKSKAITCGRQGGVQATFDRLAAPTQPKGSSSSSVAEQRRLPSSSTGCVVETVEVVISESDDDDEPVPLSEQLDKKTTNENAAGGRSGSTTKRSHHDPAAATAVAAHHHSGRPSINERSKQLGWRGVERQAEWDLQRRQKLQQMKQRQERQELEKLQSAPKLNNVSAAIVEKNRQLHHGQEEEGSSQRVEDRLMAEARRRALLKVAAEATAGFADDTGSNSRRTGHGVGALNTSSHSSASNIIVPEAVVASAADRLYREAGKREREQKEKEREMELLGMIDEKSGQVLFQPRTRADEYFERRGEGGAAAGSDRSRSRRGNISVTDDCAEDAQTNILHRVLGGPDSRVTSLDCIDLISCDNASDFDDDHHSESRRRLNSNDMTIHERVDLLSQPKRRGTPTAASTRREGRGVEQDGQRDQSSHTPHVSSYSRLLVELKNGGTAEDPHAAIDRLSQPKQKGDCQHDDGTTTPRRRAATPNRSQRPHFSPSINKRSAQLDQNSVTSGAFHGRSRVDRLMEYKEHYQSHRERLARQKREAEDEAFLQMQAQSQTVAPRDREDVEAFAHKQSMWVAKRDQRLKKQRDDQHEHEVDGCTFAPKTTPLDMKRKSTITTSAAHMDPETRRKLLKDAGILREEVRSQKEKGGELRSASRASDHAAAVGVPVTSVQLC